MTERSLINNRAVPSVKSFIGLVKIFYNTTDLTYFYVDKVR